jgi:hypothetical protein
MNNKTYKMKKDVFLSILKIFLFIQIAVMVFELILPTSSLYKNYGYRFLTDSIFYTFVFLVALFTKDFLNKINTLSTTKIKSVKGLSFNKLLSLIKISTFLGFLGTITLLIDRVILRKIDYTLGLRHARHQWINAESPSLLSDLLSMTGNALIPMAFISIMFLFLYWEKLSNLFRFTSLSISAFNILLFAAMNGSRSIMFIQVFLLVCISTIRKCKGQTNIPVKKKGKKIDKKFFVLLLITVAYVLSVFKSSSKLGNYTSKSFFEILATNLGGILKPDYYSFLRGVLSENSIIYNVFSALLYLIHSNWTTEAVFMLSEKPGSVFSYSISNFLFHIGVLSEAPTGYVFEGLFISLPGSILYDFGFSGILIFAITYGALLGITIKKIMAPDNNGGISLSIILFTLSSIYVAHFIPAHSFIFFNFIIIDVVLLHFIITVIYGNSSWLYLETEKGMTVKERKS